MTAKKPVRNLVKKYKKDYIDIVPEETHFVEPVAVVETRKRGRPKGSKKTVTIETENEKKDRKIKENALASMNRYIVVDGETVKLSDACEKFGIRVNSVYQRCRRKNESEQDAFDYFRSMENQYPYVFGSKRYKSISAFCRAKRISQTLLIYYMKTYDMTFDQAYYMLQSNDIVVLGKKYSSAWEACKALGVVYSSVYHRATNENETISEAIEHFVIEKNLKRSIPVYDGEREN